MSRRDRYRHIEAFIEQEEIGWMRDGALGQPVTVMMCGDSETLEPVACKLSAWQARTLAFELLVEAEHAERLSDPRKGER